MSSIIIQGETYNNVPSVTFNKVGGGTATYTEGGGGGVTVEQLNVSAAGTYTAPTGTAYSPVVVPSGTEGTPTATKGTVSSHSITVTPSVTNTGGYISGSTKTGTAVTISASELVSGTKSITSNGTVDVTQYASADVNVSNWTLLGSKDFTINQTGESNTSIGSITIGTSAWTKDNVIWVRTRDKAGARNGYYFGSDTMFFNANAENGVASTYSVRTVNTIRYNSSQFACYNGAYGVFAYSITTAGKVNIYARYNSTYSLTINGTFSVEVYSLTLPTGKAIF